MSDSEYGSDNDIVIIDNGSNTIRAGFADTKPRAVFPSIVGRPRRAAFLYGGLCDRDAYVGDEAVSKRAFLKMIRPMEDGSITSWHDMEKVWHDTFSNELRIQPEQHPVLMTEASYNPRRDREKATQIMFETFNVPAFYLANQSVMAMIGYGYSTGILVNSGYARTHTVAVYDGYKIQHAVSRLEVGGKHIDEYLNRLMRDRGYSFITHSEREILTNIKEEHSCFVPFDPDYKGEDRQLVEISNQAAAIREANENYNYELPDGGLIEIGQERFEAAEALFKPSLIGKEAGGIHKLVIQTAEKCDIDLRKRLYETICIAGGNSKIDGFAERLKNEIELDEEISKKKTIKAKIKVDKRSADQEVSDRALLTWRGCAIKAKIFHDDEIISVDDYDEYGPGIVHRKCF